MIPAARARAQQLHYGACAGMCGAARRGGAAGKRDMMPTMRINRMDRGPLHERRGGGRGLRALGTGAVHGAVVGHPQAEVRPRVRAQIYYSIRTEAPPNRRSQ